MSKKMLFIDIGLIFVGMAVAILANRKNFDKQFGYQKFQFYKDFLKFNGE